jgi:hypothetical protein
VDIKGIRSFYGAHEFRFCCRDRYNVKTTGINFMGVSLGALEGAYVSVINADERKFGTAKYLPTLSRAELPVRKQPAGSGAQGE